MQVKSDDDWKCRPHRLTDAEKDFAVRIQIGIGHHGSVQCEKKSVRFLFA